MREIGRTLSLHSAPERVFALLDSRYAGYAAWEAIRLTDLEVACKECLAQLQSELPISVACRMLELTSLAYYYSREYVAVVQALEQVLVLCPMHPLLHVVYAESLGRIGKVDLAADILNSIAEEDSADCELLMFVAGSLDVLGFSRQAFGIATEACSTEPYQAPYLANLSYYACKVHGLVPSVVNLARQAVQLEPHEMSYRVWLSKVLTCLGRQAEAYRAVANATDAQIASIDCTCCLAQLAKIYERNRDMRRFALTVALLRHGEEDFPVSRARPNSIT